MSTKPAAPVQQRTVLVTFSACGHTESFTTGAKTTAPARCGQGCDPVAPQHRKGR